MSVKLQEALGQTFIVENRAGAGSNLGTSAVARATPDGYTLLVVSSAFVVNPSLYKNVPYDAFKDFAPVCELDTSPNVFVATPASGITSIRQMIERARARPDDLVYASAGVGTTPHLAAELLKITENVRITHVPYGGSGPATQSILAGTVPLMCGSLPGVHGSIKSGALRALAVTGAKRWKGMPDIPTMIEGGVPGYDVTSWLAAYAPAGTPRPIVDKLSGWIGSPLTREQRLKKFYSCSRRVLDDAAANRVLEAVEKLETLSDITAIMDVLRCDGGVK